MSLEILDITTVTCDGRHALVDVDVWSPTLRQVAVVRCSWVLGDRDMKLVDASDTGLGEAVVASQEVLDDVREIVLYQRDENREKN